MDAKTQKTLNLIAAKFDERLTETTDGFEEEVVETVDLTGKFLSKCFRIKFVKDHSCIITIVPLKKSYWITTRVDLELEPQQVLKAKSVTLADVTGEYKGEPYDKTVIYAVDL